GVVAASTWFELSGATLSPDRKTVTYTVTDNGPGDSDGTVGSISDPFALVAGPVGGGAVAIPVDAPWALGLLSAVLGFLGWRRQRSLARGSYMPRGLG
ncbi:MAG: IPTL-CTERM sorting domain-containing protein, partial [Alphaproteobacteria bacterium]|nr:IPTL-CTERM sorting domain-containing protein [Alphaproteobacteria bacterium]